MVLIAGASKDSRAQFAEWHQGEGQKSFDLPANLQGLGKVFVRFETPGQSGGSAQTEACVRFQGHPKKHYSFDDGEDHDVDANDGDDNECLC